MMLAPTTASSPALRRPSPALRCRTNVRRRAFGSKHDSDRSCDCDDDYTSADIAESIIKVRDRFSVSRNRLETDRIKMVAEIVSSIRALSKKEIAFVKTVIEEKCSTHRAAPDTGADADSDSDAVPVSDEVH